MGLWDLLKRSAERFSKPQNGNLMLPTQDTEKAPGPRIYGVFGKADRMDRTVSCLFSLFLHDRSFLLEAVRNAAGCAAQRLEKKGKRPGQKNNCHP